MKKRVAIPLSILAGLIFWATVFYIIGRNVEKISVEQPKPTSQSVQKQKSEPRQAVEPQTPQPVVEESQQMAVPEPQPQVSQTQSENILLRANLIEAPVVNGVGKRIGTRAYITLPQEVLFEVVTLEDCGEFYRSFKDKHYNVVTIVCPEGTGLVFSGDAGIASFGPIDEFGRSSGQAHWTIIYDESTGAFRELKNP
jgi:hypothetical protein